MITFARGMTDEDVKAAALYFGAMKWTPWIKVIETNTVPKISNVGHMFLAEKGSEKEPIGNRSLEVPVNTEATAVLRDDHSGFIAYAPVGSIKKGEVLVTNGGGERLFHARAAMAHTWRDSVPCRESRADPRVTSCASFMIMQQGFCCRTGLWTEQMKPVVST